MRDDSFLDLWYNHKQYSDDGNYIFLFLWVKSIFEQEKNIYSSKSW